MTISLARNLTAGDRLVRSRDFGGWRPVLYGSGIAGSNVGLMGMGRVGRAIAERLNPFGCTMRYWDRNRLTPESEAELGIHPAGWEELLERSEYVILGLPLTTETKHLIDRKALGLMKPGAYLINPARGSIVDEAAVAEALRSGHLGGYAAARRQPAPAELKEAAEVHSWNFQTGDLNLTVPPTQSLLIDNTLASAINPADIRIFPRKMVGVDLTQVIDIIFPGPIDPNSIDLGDLLISIEPIMGDPRIAIPPNLRPGNTVFPACLPLSQSIAGMTSPAALPPAYMLLPARFQ